MPRSHRLSTPAWGLACSLALALAWPALALADTARFEIKAEPLSDALKAFAQQAHMQLLYEYAIVRDIRGNTVIGVIEKHAALEELLRNTGLQAVFSSDSAATIRPVLTRMSPDAPKSSTKETDRKGKTGKNSTPGATGMEEADDGAAADTNSAKPTPLNKESPALQEVIVTAQLYRQPAFDVPISLDIVTAKELADLRILSVASLQYAVPGVYVQTGAGFNRITIDGVGNGIGSGALVGEYINDADITGEGETGSTGWGTGDVSLNDVDHVEVLHGPQGTLYGDGSMGGVIRVITNKPDLYQVQFGSEVAALFSQFGAPSQHIQTMLNVPLVSGTLGLRFAGDFEHDGGWIDEPEANITNVNSRNLTNARVEALWRPSDDLSVSAMQIIRRDAYGIGWGEDLQGNIQAPLAFGLTTVPHGAQTFNLTNLTVSYRFLNLQAVSSSTYFTHSISRDNVFTNSQLSASVNQYFLYPHESTESNDYSEELRLSNGGGPWQWTLGGFYKRYSDTDAAEEAFTYSTPATPIADLNYTGYDTGSKSTAAFVNTSYTVTPNFEVGAGVRYYQAHETYNLPTINYNGYAGLGIVSGEFEEGDFHSTDPRAFLRYRLTSNINAYVNASKGFREGGFNSPGLPNYQPEILKRYDIGLKSRLLDDHLQANLDLFYSDYTNYVVEGYSPALNNYYEGNAGTAHIKGVEADVAWRVGNAWRLSLNGEYVDAHFVSITSLHTEYTVGDQVPLVTKYSFSAFAERDFEWHGRQGYVLLNYSEVSGVQYRVIGYIYALAQSNVMRLLNLNSSISLTRELSVGMFARNLLNDRGYLDPFWIYGEGSRQEPRTFGVDFRVRL